MFEFSTPAWQARAACLPGRIPEVWREFVKEPSDLFFPRGKGELTNAWKNAIRSICGDCPVKAECLDHALKHEELGWWAGISPLDRDRMRRDLGIALRTPEIDPYTRKVIGTFHEAAHGTMERYRRHRTDGEEPCPACKQAHSDYFADHRAKAYAKWKANASEEEKAQKRAEAVERNKRRHRETPVWSDNFQEDPL